jgi:hypothetical protein
LRLRRANKGFALDIPLVAGLLQPYRADSKLQEYKRTQLDRLYQKILDDLDELLGAVGIKAA